MDENTFKLPPLADIRHAIKKPKELSYFPIIDCRILFDQDDIKEAIRVDSAKRTAFPRGRGLFADEDSNVYFIKANGINSVKIGRAKPRKMNDRLMELQIGSPVKLAVILMIDCRGFESTHSIEIRLHEKFKNYRLHGEWFSIEGKLLEFLKASIDDYEVTNG